jgi:hypothetical protein
MFIRASLSDEYRENDRWHVPDDHAGHITAKAMSEPELVGIGPHDPFFDITFALVRYPIYDQLTLCRPRDDVGGQSTVCDGLIIREIPPATAWFVREIRQRSIVLVGDKTSIELLPATDTGPLPLRPAATQPLYRPVPKPAPLYHEGPLEIVAGALLGVSHRKSQGLGASNWGQSPIVNLQIKTSDGSYTWTNPIRGGGGGENLSVTELTLSGNIHVTYMDGNGNSRTADFENVPDIHGTNDPQRIFTFDAGYNALVHCYDILDGGGRRDDKWLLPAGGPRPDQRLNLPQLIGVDSLPNGIPPSSALIRYPRNDVIAEHGVNQMIGGDYYDVTSHDTPDGIARYRIESITATEMVLVRDGKRIKAPLITDAAGK